MKLVARLINRLSPKVWQKIGFGAIIAITLILEVCSYNHLHYYADWRTIAVEIVWVVICVCIVIWPRKASFMVLIWMPLTIVSPHIDYSSMMLTMFICLAIAIITQHWYTVLASCGVSSWLFLTSDLKSSYVLAWWLVITIIASATIKHYLHTIRQQQEQLFTQRYHVFQKYATIAAIRLHDEVTNELSNITMIAQQSLDPQTSGQQERENSQQILGCATETLHRARQIISLLDNAATMSRDEISRATTRYQDFYTGLRVFADNEQRSLQRLGYIGSITITDDLASQDAHHMRLPFEECAQTEYICRELLANVKKHAIKPKEYAMNVILSENECHLVCMNSAQHGVFANLQLGYGLRFHKELVERAGGTFSVQEDGDSWIINVHMPLHLMV